MGVYNKYISARRPCVRKLMTERGARENSAPRCVCIWTLPFCSAKFRLQIKNGAIPVLNHSREGHIVQFAVPPAPNANAEPQRQRHRDIRSHRERVDQINVNTALNMHSLQPNDLCIIRNNFIPESRTWHSALREKYIIYIVLVARNTRQPIANGFF